MVARIPITESDEQDINTISWMVKAHNPDNQILYLTNLYRYSNISVLNGNKIHQIKDDFLTSGYGMPPILFIISYNFDGIRPILGSVYGIIQYR